jgi:hypothetical protein
MDWPSGGRMVLVLLVPSLVNDNTTVSACLSIFCERRTWTQGFMLTKQALCRLSPSPILYSFDLRLLILPDFVRVYLGEEFFSFASGSFLKGLKSNEKISENHPTPRKSCLQWLPVSLSLLPTDKTLFLCILLFCMFCEQRRWLLLL